MQCLARSARALRARHCMYYLFDIADTNPKCWKPSKYQGLIFEHAKYEYNRVESGQKTNTRALRARQCMYYLFGIADSHLKCWKPSKCQGLFFERSKYECNRVWKPHPSAFPSSKTTLFFSRATSIRSCTYNLHVLSFWSRYFNSLGLEPKIYAWIMV